MRETLGTEASILLSPVEEFPTAAFRIVRVSDHQSNNTHQHHKRRVLRILRIKEVAAVQRSGRLCPGPTTRERLALA